MFQEVDSRQINAIEHCAHCQGVVLHPFKDSEGHIFCCSGCRSVFQILNDNKLTEFYDLSANFKINAIKQNAIDFNYLDSEQFQTEFTHVDGEIQTIDFYLEGIHCMACLWLIEKLNEVVDGVVSSRLNFAKSVVTIKVIKGAQLSKVAQMLNSLGYRPHVILNDQHAKNLKDRENHSLLIKIGVAAASSMNIMIYAISVYAGAELTYSQYFNWISFGFALPVVSFSAIPFYASAWNKLKTKQLSIDLPISVAIIIGFLSGLYNTLLGVEENYFDSISMLVFLLLSSRYLLKKIQENSLDTTSYKEFFAKGSVLKFNPNKNAYQSVHEKYIELNDVIKIKPAQTIPVDGILLEGKALVNEATLTGEARAKLIKASQVVFSGTVNLEDDIVIKVTAIGENTRIGKILKAVEEGKKSKAPIVQFADKLSKYFVVGVFILSTVNFIYSYFMYGFEIALSRFVAIIIVTCPCALGLATPLTFTKSLASAIKNSMIIKSEDVIESLAKVKNLFLDKTGTITYGEYKVNNLEIIHPDEKLIKNIIYSLELKSSHPIAIAITNYLHENASVLGIDHYIEIQGQGVEGEVSGKKYAIKKWHDEKAMNTLAIYENDRIVAKMYLADQIREDSKDIIAKIKNSFENIFILSGDKQVNVDLVGNELGLAPENLYGDMSPELKNEKILQSSSSLMVGDGANDALALTNSNVGVAVHGSVDVSLRAADVYMSQEGLSNIYKLIILSNETMKVVKRNLAFSLVYNIVGAFLAMNGKVSPLSAAIIMPLSSLTVLFSTIVGTQKLREEDLWK